VNVLTARRQQQTKMANGNRLPIEYMEQSSHQQWSDEDDVSRWIRNAFDGPNNPGDMNLASRKFCCAAFSQILFSLFPSFIATFCPADADEAAAWIALGVWIVVLVTCGCMCCCLGCACAAGGALARLGGQALLLALVFVGFRLSVSALRQAALLRPFIFTLFN
jgi:hypothetical protein